MVFGLRLSSGLLTLRGHPAHPEAFSCGPGPRPRYTPQRPPGPARPHRPEDDLGLSEGRHQPPAEELRGVRDMKDTKPDNSEFIRKL